MTSHTWLCDHYYYTLAVIITIYNEQNPHCKNMQLASEYTELVDGSTVMFTDMYFGDVY